MTTQEVAYPPLASTDEYPLHPEGIYDDPLWACSTPERPRDSATTYDWRCRVCVLAAQAHVANQGDSTGWWTPTRGADPRPVASSWLIARSLFWFGAA